MLRLARIDGRENLILCEARQFATGYTGVELTLRRAAISGRVDVGGEIKNHFADALDKDGDIVDTIALDRRSYAALKKKWMRCKVDAALSGGKE